MTSQTCFLFLGLLITLCARPLWGQCPWSRELVDLHADCICAYNNVQRLSIQCSPVNFTRLMQALHASVQNIPIDMLYVNNSTIETVPDGIFKRFDIQSLHLSRSKVTSISANAFEGLEQTLTGLHLQDNAMSSVPIEAIQKLTSLKELDLSHNRITSIPDAAFRGLPITTLKLSDNQLNVSGAAFRGLELTLKTLNLKGTGLSSIPKAVQHLGALALLDLAQNNISFIEPGSLADMHKLTALLLERNRITRLDSRTFLGVNDTLSSLSLLNNLLADFPKDAIASLTEIRVLDLGFNGLKVIPNDAFKHNTLLTLLALDGNPLPTVPLAAFQHLNSTLRGLSVGGPQLECNCHIRWISEWVKRYNLQISSRERNPQYCGKPDHLRRRSFQKMSPGDFVCDDEETSSEPITTTSAATTTTTALPTAAPSSTESVITPIRTEGLSTSRSLTTKGPKRLDYPDNSRPSPSVPRKAFSSVEEVSLPVVSVGVSSPQAPQLGRITSVPVLPTRQSIQSRSDAPDSRVQEAPSGGITIEDAYRENPSSVVIKWKATSGGANGYRALYRLFGSNDFQQSSSLTRSRRSYVFDGLPSKECVVVCVVALDDLSTLPSVEDVPYDQCREVAGQPVKSLELDKVVIGASAAISGIIVIAVLIFICCYCRNRKEKSVVPPTAIPVATMPAVKSDHEWETSSMYSGRSIPRARMYHLEPNGNGSVNHSFVMEDNRSHISHFSQVPNGYPKAARSTADGQSHRSYSQFSNRFSNGHALGNPEIRKSQLSLSQLSGHHSFLGSQMSTAPGNKKKRGNGRLTSSASMHSLTEYGSDWNGRPNWKDQEVDIYVDQNHVVPTHNKYSKDYGAR